MFEINGTLVVFVASFLVFMALLNEIMLKPVGKALAKRAEKIHGDLNAAKDARQTAAALVDKYESDLKRIRSEAHTHITSAMASASKEKNELLAKVQQEGTAKVAAFKAELSAERTRLIDDLVAQERELVETITQKVLGEPVTVQLDATKVRKTLEEAC